MAPPAGTFPQPKRLGDNTPSLYRGTATDCAHGEGGAPVRHSPVTLPAVDQPAPELTQRHLLYALVGAGLLLAVGVLVFASNLVAPLWAVILLIGVWVAAVVASVVTWRHKPWMPLLAALGVAAAWMALISFGGAVLDWRA